MKRTPLQLVLIALAAAVAMGLLLLLSNGGVLATWALDRLWGLNGPFRPRFGNTSMFGQSVVIAAIDNATLRQFRGSGLRLPRSVYAQAVDRLTAMGARRIAFDVTFSEAGEPAEDGALRESVQRSDRVVTNCFLRNDEAFSRLWVEGRAFFRAVAKGEGLADLTLDRDHFVRRMRLYAPKGELPCRVSFALAIYLQDIGRTPDQLEYRGSSLVVPPPDYPGLSSTTIDLDHLGHSLIGFLGGPGTLPTFSVADLLSGKIATEAIRDKFVLVGGTAEEFRDSFHTPFSPKGDMPGVEIHGHILENLLAMALPRGFSGPLWWAMILGLAGLAGAFSGWFRQERSFFILLVLSGVWLPVNILLFRTFGFFCNMFDVWAALGLGWVIATVIDVLLLREEKNTITRMFRRYVSPNLLNELMENPEAIALGGARREAVVFFADVRGFTSICEDSQPEKVISFLNRYFNAMTQVIFDHGGILDKYIGDGMMVFFGVPIRHGNEPEQSVRAALKMREMLAELRATRQTPADFPIEKIGIGIHGGEVVVGNVGSEVHQEYTLLGDTVNVAARLESNASAGEILVSGWIASRLPVGMFEVRPRGLLKVRGRKGEIEAFEVLRYQGSPPAHGS